MVLRHSLATVIGILRMPFCHAAKLDPKKTDYQDMKALYHWLTCLVFLLVADGSPAFASEKGWGWFARGGSGDSKWAIAEGAKENRPDNTPVRGNPLPKLKQVPGMMLEATLSLFFPDRGAPAAGVAQAAPTSSSWRSRTIPARPRQ